MANTNQKRSVFHGGVMRISRIVLAGATILLAGCSSQEVTGPPLPVTTRSMILVSPNTIFGIAGGEVKSRFAVKVVSYPGSQPVAGAVVTFAVAGHPTPAYSAVTNTDGIATLDSMRLEANPGRYDISAITDGAAGSVSFTAIVLSQAPIAIYDLKTGGPLGTDAYPGPNFTPGVTGGHYVLLSDGTYLWGYELNFIATVSQPFRFTIQDPQTVDFYEMIPGVTPDPNRLFSVGTLSANTMTVKYKDTVDFEDEVYVLRQ